MDHNCQSPVDRQMLQKRNPSLNSKPYDRARENSAGDGNKANQPTPKSTSNTQRIDDLEKLISRLNNAMLTLEEENLKLHERLRNNIETRAHVTPDQSLDTNCREKQTFSSESTEERNSSNSGLLQDDTYVQLKNENNHIKKTLKEAEKCRKQHARDFQKLLQKYEDIKERNQILEQHNKQLVNDKGALEEKLDILVHKKRESSQTSRGSQTDVWHVDSRVRAPTGHCRWLYSEHSTTTADGVQCSDKMAECHGVEEELRTVAETVALLREENQQLQEELRQSMERSIRAENMATSLGEEHGILEACLQTVQREKELLQVEVRALHQDYISLSNSITLHLRDQVTGEHSRSPEPHKSHARIPNDAHDAAARNSSSTELQHSTFGSPGVYDSVEDPVIKPIDCSDSNVFVLKDKAPEGRKSTVSIPSKATAENRRISRGEMELLPRESPTQTAKHGQIDKDTIERIRIRYEENEVKRAQRRVSH